MGENRILICAKRAYILFFVHEETVPAIPEFAEVWQINYGEGQLSARRR
jgi:hypothetical protein